MFRFLESGGVVLRASALVVALCLVPSLWHCGSTVPSRPVSLRPCVSQVDCPISSICQGGLCQLNFGTTEPSQREGAPDTSPPDTPASPEIKPDISCQPSPEVCDGKDNDCNGQVDDSPADVGALCDVPDGKGICAQGRSTCVGGKIVCQPNNTPAAAEVCGNGKDDNCDGQVDENPPCDCTSGEQACFSGEASKINQGPCRAGKQECQGGSWGACVGEVPPKAETCDGVDNDCDGTIDNFTFNPPTCQATEPISQATCANATRTCDQGKERCLSRPAKTVLLIPNSTYERSGKLQPCQQATFNRPYGVVVDKQGNVYISDHEHHAIRMITPAGKVSTIAGGGGYDHADGPGTNARFAKPRGMAIDDNGNIYIADSDNHVIRKLSFLTNGTCGSQSSYSGPCVTTVVGVPKQRGKDEGKKGKLAIPYGVAVDAKGNLYITDYGNHRLRMATPQGELSTLFGDYGGFKDGPANKALANRPHDVVLGPKGKVYFSDYYNHRVRLYDPQKKEVSTVLGNGVGSYSKEKDPSKVKLDHPTALAINPTGTRLVVFERYNRIIRELELDGKKETRLLAGVPEYTGLNTAAATQARLEDINGLYWTSDTLYMANFRHRVVQTLKQEEVRILAGDPKLSSARTDGDARCALLRNPQRVFADGKGSLFLPSLYSDVIYRVDLSKRMMTVWVGNGEGKSADGEGLGASLHGPIAMAFGPKDEVFVSEHEGHSIALIDAKRKVTRYAGTGLPGMKNDKDPEKAQFNKPFDLAVDAQGTLYVADSQNQLIRKIDSKGEVTTLAGQLYRPGSNDGVGAVATFNAPFGLVLRGSDLFVTDFGGHRLRHVTTSGKVTTIAGELSGFADALGSAAKFARPYGVSLAPSGQLIVADYGNNRVRLVTLGGAASDPAKVDLLAGTGSRGTNNDLPKQATFQEPTHTAFDAKGNLYILEYNNGLRMLPPCGP